MPVDLGKRYFLKTAGLTAGTLGAAALGADILHPTTAAGVTSILSEQPQDEIIGGKKYLTKEGMVVESLGDGHYDLSIDTKSIMEDAASFGTPFHLVINVDTIGKDGLVQTSTPNTEIDAIYIAKYLSNRPRSEPETNSKDTGFLFNIEFCPQEAEQKNSQAVRINLPHAIEGSNDLTYVAQVSLQSNIKPIIENGRVGISYSSEESMSVELGPVPDSAETLYKSQMDVKN